VYGHLRRGAERMAFEPIVASGSNGALPHARPTDRPLRAGDLVVLDFGGVLDGYASDMTRTVAVGEPGEEARRVHAAVREAQEAAIGAARAGIRTDELDAAARDVLRRHGLGEAFMHGLGHGIGLQTHEWPRVSYQRQDTLPPGCAITIEPGAYLEGRFGVRIEDIVVLHADGCRNLTRAPKELIVL
jgi:Xaa-Pro aminopeptidase